MSSSRPFSIAGQICLSLEAPLSASRPDLYAPCPRDATCFFNDPLARVSGARSPRCDFQYDWLWPALSAGETSTPGGRRADLYSLLGNLADDLVNQWMFFHFLHWYARPEERFERYMRIAFPESRQGGRGQVAPATRVWNGYLAAVKSVAQSLDDCPAAVPSIVIPEQRRFSGQPRWVDAFARLGDRGQLEYKFASSLLGRYQGSTASPDWRWDAPPAADPITVRVAHNRVSPRIFARLCEALAWDRWLVVERRFDMLGGPTGAFANDNSGDLFMNAALVERARALSELRRSLEDDSPPDGNMRFLGPLDADRGETGTAARALQNVDVRLRLAEKRIDRNESDLLELAGHDGLITHLLGDPLRGWFVQVEVTLGDECYETYALTYDYEKVPGPVYATGYLCMEVQRCAGIPYFDAQANAGKPVKICFDACRVRVGRVRKTGELLILLRLVLEPAPV